jgi:NADH-quinone oxidoreductase subunit A
VGTIRTRARLRALPQEQRKQRKRQQEESIGEAARYWCGPATIDEDWLHPIMLQLYFLILLTVGSLVSPNRPDPEKLSPYECGFEAFEDARMKFDVRYYLIAILFILFDLEIAFLFPWAVVLPEIGIFGFWSMMIFLAILIVGFIYEWKKGALEWE